MSETAGGVPGVLRPEQFGFTGPASATNIDAPPHHYRGLEMVTFAFETSTSAAAAIVPAELTLANEPAQALLWFSDFHFSTLGAYREAILAISCLYEGRRVLYCPYLIVTGDVGLIAGREIWGAPKLLGHVEWRTENSVISCSVSRPAGVRLASGTLRPRDPVPARSTEGPPLVFLKVIPSPEQGAPPEVCELVEVSIDSTPHLDSAGRPLVFTGPGSVHFDTLSVADPWAALSVSRVLRATYGRYDSTLGYGRVLHRYNLTS